MEFVEEKVNDRCSLVVAAKVRYVIWEKCFRDTGDVVAECHPKYLGTKLKKLLKLWYLLFLLCSYE